MLELLADQSDFTMGMGEYMWCAVVHMLPVVYFNYVISGC